jgi:hypothetical protein
MRRRTNEIIKPKTRELQGREAELFIVALLNALTQCVASKSYRRRVVEVSLGLRNYLCCS